MSPSPQSGDPGADADAIWAARRRMVEQFWGTFAGWPVIIILVAPLAVWLHSNVLIWIIGLAWMGLYGLLGIRLSRFRCPRCGEMFAWRRFAWTAKCGHCGIRVGDPLGNTKPLTPP